MTTPYTEPEFVIVEDVEETVVEVTESPPGADGPQVHFDTDPPEDEDGNMGDFWVVV